MENTNVKSKNIEWYKLEPMEVYNLLLSGAIKKFPNGFITKDNMKRIIREVILNQHNMKREDICRTLRYGYLKKLKLGGSKIAFNANIFELISYCFPEMDIKYWELNKVKDGFWEKEENRKEYMLWLAEKEKIKLDSLEDIKRIDARLITKNHGSKVLKFGGGVYSLILLVAQVDVKEWQVIKMSVWTEEKVVEAVKWLIEEELNWSKEDVIAKISAKTFYEHDLGGLLCKYCDHSPIRALNVAYPGEYTKVRNSRPEYLRKA